MISLSVCIQMFTCTRVCLSVVFKCVITACVCVSIVFIIGHFVRGFYHQYSQTRKMVFMVLIIPVVTLSFVVSCVTVFGNGNWEYFQ